MAKKRAVSLNSKNNFKGSSFYGLGFPERKKWWSTITLWDFWKWMMKHAAIYLKFAT